MNIEKINAMLCTGCCACYNICKQGAIDVKINKDGFIFPTVNDSCVDCGRCIEVCPVENPQPLNPEPESYAVWAKDEIRKISSSGGMFTLISEYIIERCGIVFGATYSNDYKSVYHIACDKISGLEKLRGSKYVQSDIKNTYQECERQLKSDRLVFFTGCPCQIAGLYSYLGKKYKNLITADLICHSSTSIKAYRLFLNEFSENKDILKVNFRDKNFYEWSTPQVVYLKDGTVKKNAWNEGGWNKSFLEGYVCRDSCFVCRYATIQRIGDLTLGDCWQVHRINPTFDDRLGTSLVLVNTSKGQLIFDNIRNKMKLCEKIPLKEIRKYNGALNKPCSRSPYRALFFQRLDTDGFHNSLNYCRKIHFDVGIVGWWFASNYGSALTYYALGRILEKLGKKLLLIPIAKKDGRSWEKEVQNTIIFISKYFRVAKNRTYGDMDDFNKYCDSFMLGSDQLWTVGAVNIVGYSFFLDFVDENKKKIAFSTSFGASVFDAEKQVLETAKDLLNNFDAISVRESKGVEIFRDKFGMNVDQLIDPVFLCSIEDYDILTCLEREELPAEYLFCYILDPNPEIEEAVKYIASREHLEILVVFGIREYGNSIHNWNTGKIISNVSFEMFLYYIKNCNFMVTDSHHGTCFSIIYHKKYIAFVNKKRGAQRFETVAQILGLEDRLCYSGKDVYENQNIFEKIDYSMVDKKINVEKYKAIDWLKNAFDKPTKRGLITANIECAKIARERDDLKNRLAMQSRDQ